MTNTGGPRAWQYLKRNPDYVESWRQSAIPAPDEPAPFPLRTHVGDHLKARIFAHFPRQGVVSWGGSVAKSAWLVTCLRDLPRGVEA